MVTFLLQVAVKVVRAAGPVNARPRPLHERQINAVFSIPYG